MDDNRTMAQLLKAPRGYEDAIVVPEITADNFELKHGLLTLVQNKQFFGHDKEDPHAHIRLFQKNHFTMKFPETSRLILDKKNQSPAPTPVKAVEESCVTCGGAHSYQTCPATTGNVYRDNIQEYVSQAAAANYNQGNIGYRAPISNQIRPHRQLSDAFDVMPKFASDSKTLIRNKEKLSEMARTPLNEIAQRSSYTMFQSNLEDPGPISYSCDSPGLMMKAWPILEQALSYAYSSILCQTPSTLILGRSFLMTSRALIDVYEGVLTLRVGSEAITFNIVQTSRYTAIQSYDAQTELIFSFAKKHDSFSCYIEDDPNFTKVIDPIHIMTLMGNSSPSKQFLIVDHHHHLPIKEIIFRNSKRSLKFVLKQTFQLMSLRMRKRQLKRGSKSPTSEHRLETFLISGYRPEFFTQKFSWEGDYEHRFSIKSWVSIGALCTEKGWLMTVVNNENDFTDSIGSEGGENDSDELIKSSVENLVLIPSEFEGISDDTCDVPVCEDPSTFDALNDHSEILSDSNDDGTSSDDDDFEDIEYVRLEEVNDVDQEEKEIDLVDILQIQDVILREKLLNISRLIINIESLKDNPIPNRVLKSPFSVLIFVTDSNSFFEKSDTSFSFLDNSLPEFETFSDHTEETRSGSTTTYANNSLPEYESFLFKIEPDQGGLISIVISDNSNDPLLELPEFESFHFDLYDDPSFPRPPPKPPDV
ncbi:hypothetical protein Tco_0569677 [Tanacetum coccineum]